MTLFRVRHGRVTTTTHFPRHDSRRRDDRLRRRHPHAARPARAARARATAGPEIFLKLETLQPIGSFKIRGAYNAVRAPVARRSWRSGVWTVSAGNAAQGVALAARKAGAALQRHGHGHGARHQAARHRAARRDDRQGDRTRSAGRRSRTHRSDRMHGHFVHPFDDDHFISGNGTIGLEILEDLPDVDAVIAPLGGGGLLSGIARVAAGAAARRARLRRGTGDRRAAVGVAPRRARPSRFDGWQASFVDGAGGKSVLPTMWPLLQRMGRRLDRRHARRGGAGDAARRRARARHRRRRRRAARSPRRCRRHSPRAATGRSSPSSPAATSISSRFARARSSACERSTVTRHVNLSSDQLKPHTRYRDAAASRTPAAAARTGRPISGGAGTRRRARSSASSTTRCGGRRRTTRCGCCGWSRRRC